VTRRAVATIAASALVVALALVLVGRWEAGRRADEENAGMRRVLAAVGELDSPTLSAFRMLGDFQCLLYGRDGNLVALELCVTPGGRVVEAIDRRGSGDPEIASLRDDPSRSTVRVDRAEVDRLLVRMGVPPRLVAAAHERGG
jgi:hypothetical protein